jgi:hypothetical protein
VEEAATERGEEVVVLVGNFKYGTTFTSEVPNVYLDSPNGRNKVVGR